MLSVRLLFICFLFTLHTFSQEQSFRIKYELDKEEGVYNFFFESNSPGSVTVNLKFTELINTSHSNLLIETVSGYSGQITSLSPINTEEYPKFRYTYRYRYGRVSDDLDKEFTYLLPYPKGVSAQAHELFNLKETYFNTPENKSWKAYRFRFENETNVCAIRKGIVINIKNDSQFRNMEVSYSSKNNYIIVEHPDGSLVRYSYLKNNSMIVEIGDTIFPNQIIAKSGKVNKEDPSEVRLLLYYLINDQLNFEKEEFENKTSYYEYLDPNFLIGGKLEKLKHNEDYISDVSEEIITKEMNKKELKYWLKNHTP